jgi:hypothetical protein
VKRIFIHFQRLLCSTRIGCLPALGFETEVLLDVFCKSIVDLGMARDRLLLVRCGVAVNVMPGSVTVQNAAGFRELLD